MAATNAHFRCGANAVLGRHPFLAKNMEMTDEVRNETEAVTKCCYLPWEARRALAASDVFGSQGPAGTLVFIRGGDMRRKSVVSENVGPTLVLAGSLL